MSPPPRVRLVVLNYNGGDLVVRCVEHLERLDWPDDGSRSWWSTTRAATAPTSALEHRPRAGSIRSRRQHRLPRQQPGAARPRRRRLRGPGQQRRLRRARLPAAAGRRPRPTTRSVRPAPRSCSPRSSSTCASVPTARSLRRRPRPGRAAQRPRGRRQGPLASTVFAEGLVPSSGARRRARVPLVGGEALVRVPVEPAVDAPPGLACASAATPHAGPGSTAAPRSRSRWAEPAWVDVPLGGEPYDVVNNVGSVLVEGGWGGDRGFLEPDHRAVRRAPGRVRLVRRRRAVPGAYLREVGLFDERFFMYYEDTDMAWRGRARGWRYRYVPDAVLRHVHAATSVEGSPLFHHYVERNRLVMLTKNAPPDDWPGARLAVPAVDRRRTPGETWCALCCRGAARRPGSSGPGCGSFAGLPAPAAPGADRRRLRGAAAARRGDHGLGGASDENRGLQPLLGHRRRRREVRRRHRPDPGGRRPARPARPRADRRRLARRPAAPRPVQGRRAHRRRRAGEVSGRQRRLRPVRQRLVHELRPGGDAPQPLRRALPDPARRAPPPAPAPGRRGSPAAAGGLAPSMEWGDGFHPARGAPRCVAWTSGRRRLASSPTPRPHQVEFRLRQPAPAQARPARCASRSTARSAPRSS